MQVNLDLQTKAGIRHAPTSRWDLLRSNWTDHITAERVMFKVLLNQAKNVSHTECAILEGLSGTVPMMPINPIYGLISKLPSTSHAESEATRADGVFTSRFAISFVPIQSVLRLKR